MVILGINVTFFKFGFIGLLMSLIVSIDSHVKGHIMVPETVENYKMKNILFYVVIILVGGLAALTSGYLAYSYVMHDTHFTFIVSGLGGIFGRDITDMFIKNHIDKKYYEHIFNNNDKHTKGEL